MAAPEALAFDMYGTLVDPIGIRKQLEEYLPEEALNAAGVWRRKRLEYTFRLAAMERYEGFEQVTRKALDYALAAAGQNLGPQHKSALMARYGDLERFADVEPDLKMLEEAGHAMVVFPNGTVRMPEALVDAAELRPCFQGLVSVDEVKAYKPSPKAYRHVSQRLERPIGGIRLISSNPFDDVGAEAAGMRAAWVDRSGGPFDTLGSPPEVVVGSLTELADALG